jgi:predicted nucleic acid-binding protein
MPIRIVRAEVIDIRRDRPSDQDEMLVDTNSWFNLTYTRIKEPKAEYPDYIKRSMASNAKLYASGLSLAELASAIERSECNLYAAANGIKIDLKTFRHDCEAERKIVVSAVTASWAQVKSIARVIEHRFTEASADAALKCFQSSSVDGYDIVMLDAMERCAIRRVLTDDGDFATVPGIQVFTANPATISAARRAGQLLIR